MSTAQAFDPLFCAQNHRSDLNCSILLNGFRVYTSQLSAGVKKYNLPTELRERLKSFYPRLNLAIVQFGFSGRQPHQNATTVCNNIYFNSPVQVNEIRTMNFSSPRSFHWLLHELAHVQQCHILGSAEEFAYRWMKAAAGIVYQNARSNPMTWDWNRIHDAMPMEAEADRVAYINLAKIKGFVNTPFVGDFNGDGRDQVATYNPLSRTVFLNGRFNFNVGAIRAIPLAGDVDGDGKDEIILFTPSFGKWDIYRTNGTLIRTISFARRSEYIPFVSDVNGDGLADLIAYRPSDSRWFAQSSIGVTYVTGVRNGTLGSVPMVGDYDGDGHTDFMVYNPENSQWRSVDRNGVPVLNLNNYGRTKNYVPLAADFSGDRVFDFGLFRMSDNNFYARKADRNILSSIRVISGARYKTPVLADLNGNGISGLVIYNLRTHTTNSFSQ